MVTRAVDQIHCGFAAKREKEDVGQVPDSSET